MEFQATIFQCPLPIRPERLWSPTVNVAWALFNIIAGYFLFNADKVFSNYFSTLIFFVGIAAISIMLSKAFADKMR
jgi:hypothetical protein